MLCFVVSNMDSTVMNDGVGLEGTMADECITSGTNTEICIPDHWVQAAVIVKIRTFKLNPDLFRTTF